MENKKSLLLVFAIIAVSVFVSSFQDVKALVFTQVNAPSSNSASMTRYVSYGTAGYYVTIQGNNKYVMNINNASNGNLLNVINFTSAVNGAGKTLRSLWCINQDGICVVGYQGASGQDRVILFDILHGTVPTLADGANYTASNVDTVTMSHGFVQDTVQVVWRNAGAGHAFIDFWLVPQNFNTNKLVFVSQYDTGFTQDFSSSAYGTFTNGTNTPVNNYLGLVQSSSTNFVSINLGTLSTKCQHAPSASSLTDVDYFTNSTDGKSFWLVASGVSTQWYKISETCATVTTGDYGTTFASANVRGVTYNDVRKEFYFVENGQVGIVNATGAVGSISGTTKFLGRIQTAGDSGINNRQIAFFNNTSIFVIQNNALMTLTYFGSPNGIGGTGGTGQQTYKNSAGQTCVNVYMGNSQTQYVTYCSSASSSLINNGMAGALGAVRSAQNVTQTGAQYICAVGLSDSACTNPNSKTNGVGYWLVLALVILSFSFVYGMVAYAASHTNANVTDSIVAVPKELVAVVLLVDLGIAYFGGWTDGLLFFTFIAIIAGVTTFSLYRRVNQ